MPKEAWGRAADAAADMSESETYLWDSVCSAGMFFCYNAKPYERVWHSITKRTADKIALREQCM